MKTPPYIYTRTYNVFVLLFAGTRYRYRFLKQRLFFSQTNPYESHLNMYIKIVLLRTIGKLAIGMYRCHSIRFNILNGSIVKRNLSFRFRLM